MLPPLHKRVSPTSTAFTLVEVLVVVAILAVLTSLLIPVVGKLKEARNNSVCTSNLKQIGIAFESYAAENNNRYPPVKAPVGGNFSYPYSLRLYLPGYTEFGGSDSTRSVYICPAWLEVVKGYKSNTHYSINEFLYDGLSYFDEPPKSWINKPARTILLGDMCWFTQNGHPFSTVNNDRLPGISYREAPAVPPRHAQGAANLLFADGHVEYWQDVSVLRDIKYRNRGVDDVWRPDK